MKTFNNKDPNFLKDLQFFLNNRAQDSNEEIDFEVKSIIREVKEKGDEALFYFSKKYDGTHLNKSNLLIPNKIRNEYKNKITFVCVIFHYFGPQCLTTACFEMFRASVNFQIVSVERFMQ